jgi:hypothetical protein
VTTALTEKMLFSFADLGRLGVLPPGFPRKLFPAENELEFQDDYFEDDYLSADMFAVGEGFEQEIQSPVDPALEALCEEFADVFDNTEVTAMTGAPMQIHLRRSDPKYKPCKMYRARLIPHHWEEEADKTIQWFLDSGVVVKVPTSEPTEWCSPGFFVKKKEGGNKVRLVVDYRQLNKFVDRQAHPFPSPRDIVKGIREDSRWFVKFDAMQGYYQLPLDEESSRLTTFLLPSGTYRFTRGPMGLCNTSDAFCERTDAILSSVPNMLKIVDDGLLQAKTEEEAKMKLRQTLLACRKGNLTLAKSKLAIGQKIGFAGYVVSAKGVKPDPKKLEGISNFPVPTDVSSLRSFLGLAQQLGFFVPDFAHMTEELRQLLKKKNAWIWLPKHQEVFERVRRLLTSDMIVKPFDRGLKTEMLCDDYRLRGLGYALIQREINGNPRLVQCGSRSLLPAESRYATNELECLAISWSVNDCRYYLLGAQFDVITDHKPLVGTFAKDLADVANTRLMRFREKLTDYNFEVKWVAGKEHLVADALSRAPVFDPKDPEDVLGMQIKALSHQAHASAVGGTHGGDPSMRRMFEAAVADKSYQSVADAVLASKPPSMLHTAHPAKQFAGG